MMVGMKLAHPLCKQFEVPSGVGDGRTLWAGGPTRASGSMWQSVHSRDGCSLYRKRKQTNDHGPQKDKLWPINTTENGYEPNTVTNNNTDKSQKHNIGKKLEKKELSLEHL